MKLYEAITANKTWVSDGFMGLNLRAVAMIIQTLHTHNIYIYIYIMYRYMEYNDV